MQQAPDDRWYPLAASTDVSGRHIFHATLHGQEVALWRDASGLVHAWDNRCPHRGMRFTLGIHMGNAVACRYHGWRFDVSGACTYVPAHPSMKPAAILKATGFAAAEAHGFIWASLGQPTGAPTGPALRGQPWVLRSCVIHAPFENVRGALEPLHAEERLTLFVQPVNQGKCVVHGVYDGRPEAMEQELSVLRRYDARLCEVRDALEAQEAAVS
jgi:phenylpropionate dioxygenase-like ring-hydroxylating dioxygenase large terminal subunit